MSPLSVLPMSIPETLFTGAISVVGKRLVSKLCDLFELDLSPARQKFLAENNKGWNDVDRQKVDRMAGEISTAVKSFFDREAQNIPDNEREAIAFGITETIIAARLDSARLAQQSFDVSQLKDYLMAMHPDVTRGFSRDEQALYERAMAIVSQKFIDIAPQLEEFSLSVAREILQKQDRDGQVLQEILQELQIQRQEIMLAGDKFARTYCQDVQTELDRLELFGLPRMDEMSECQKLSAAYISLSVSGCSAREEKKLLHLFGDHSVELDRRIREITRRYSSIDEVLAHSRRLVIRGVAGGGKSTLLQWLAVRAAKDDSKLPFFIRLRRLVGKEFPIPDEFPKQVLPNKMDGMPSGWVRGYLERGQAIVLLDGVDELPKTERQGFFQKLQKLVQDFGEATYIVTSRPSGLKNSDGQKWEEWERWVEKQEFINLTLEPMSSRHVEDFIQRWHTALANHKDYRCEPKDRQRMVDNLQQQLRQRPELRQLASTPLLCAMICALHRQRRETLPSARLTLYKECIDMLLNRRDRGRGIKLDETYPVGLNEEQKIELLQSLALEFMLTNRSDMKVTKVDRHFDVELRQTNLPATVQGEQIRALFVERAGLLREPVIGKIDFAHRTFQEYLAAKAALSYDSWKKLLKRATNDQWREAIIVTAGLAGKKKRVKIFNDLIERGDRKPEQKHYLHLLAVACLETAATLDPTTRQRVLDCAQELLPPRDDDAVQMVVRAGNEIIPLLRYQPDYSAEEACQCIKALVAIGSEEAMETLVDYAKARFEDRDNEYEVSGAIGRGWDVFDRDIYISQVLTQLQILNLSEIQVEDISPLSQLSQLQILYLLVTRVRDISALKQLPQLRELYLSETRVKDISALKQLPQLQYLDLSRTQVEDISALKQLPQLQYLDLSGTQVEDISVLKQLSQLWYLDLSGTQVEDISVLKQLSQLWYLDLSGTQVEDISVLKQLSQLDYLNLLGTQVEDISVLDRLSQLRHLDLSLTQVEDISALKQLSQLQYLNLWGTQVEDISPLKELFQLEDLDLSETQVKDISALDKIQYLNILW
ncbi:NACHT domain-containing protein [Roseofilum casamattae]|uniref:Leucine-rich repeat domain-containing protein n=1 Tax=Roseofilum casamattae BLCC-M143 TaxID=3022442 RepID=A0ABT7BWN9_9CYAN|nr:leucine-rich repeat domain-containing protein [Roseofilum casamattae]MDJ1182929.1 leucine-rich repeat domain-containing protein [Roseofilum casamattae BLCC-M143]